MLPAQNDLNEWNEISDYYKNFNIQTKIMIVHNTRNDIKKQEIWNYNTDLEFWNSE